MAAVRVTEIRALTGVRGLAALLVVLYHMNLGQPCMAFSPGTQALASRTSGRA